MTNIETAKMSDRGQIIIPKNIREFIDASENTLFTLMPIDSNTIVMKKLDTKKIIAEFAEIRAKVKKKLSPKEINEEINKARY
ncbi:MAG: AbrB/MazE/SpoVT family DNA-binding domain-containing protein [Nanoarchaeota archaeon]|nr:AbrB/MazE/SpoVT family DNA-binding domain-containing protein [Nanoarchaeota archaeon]